MSISQDVLSLWPDTINAVQTHPCVAVFFLGSVKDGSAATDRTCCHIKLQFNLKWPLEKLHNSPWLHLWTVVDQMKANVILSVLQANNSGSGFQNVTWLRPRTSIQLISKQDLKQGTCIFKPAKGWQSEGTMSDGASTIPCSQQIKTWNTRPEIPGSYALAKHITEFCTGTTVKHRDSWYSQMRHL